MLKNKKKNLVKKNLLKSYKPITFRTTWKYKHLLRM